MSELTYNPLEGDDKYRTIKELGRGGMGEVFLGEHSALGNKVVIKLLHAELSNKSNLVDRMRIEAQACARLNHPNIVRVTDFDRTPSGRPYFVMEYLPGRSLADEVAALGGFLPVAKALDFVVQALEGLVAAHAAGLVHRDIKLDNLFVCEPGTQPGVEQRLKILDFGVAKVLDGGGDEQPAPLMVPTGTGVVVGTPRFFAPEQARGKALDHRADIYAMGLVLYSLVAGRGPFDHAKTILEMAKAHVAMQPQPPSHFASQVVPAALDQAVLRAVAKKPEERFQSAQEFAQELQRIAATLGGATGTQAMPQASPATAYQQPALNQATQGGQAQAAHHAQPTQGGYPAAPQGGYAGASGGYPAANASGGYPAANASGGYPAAHASGGYPTAADATGANITGSEAPTAKMMQRDQNLAPTSPLPSGNAGQTQAGAPPVGMTQPGGAPPAMDTTGSGAGPKRYSYGFAALVVFLSGATGAVLAFVILKLG